MLIDKYHRVLYALHIDLSACHIDNIHRLPSNARGPRPVIKFVSMLDINLIWESRNMLKDYELKVTIREHFASVTESNIRMLFPIWRATMNQKINARLIWDRLYINNQLYTVDSLGQLPDSIKPQNAAIREDDKHIFFFSGQSVLSNFHMKRLIIQDNVYVCPEQYIQSQKAKLFKCYNRAKQVLEVKSPMQMKHLGKNLPSFDWELWEKEAQKIARVCLQAKFQDPVSKSICWILVFKPWLRHFHMIKFGVLDLACTINKYYKKKRLRWKLTGQDPYASERVASTNNMKVTSPLYSYLIQGITSHWFLSSYETPNIISEINMNVHPGTNNIIIIFMFICAISIPTPFSFLL